MATRLKKGSAAAKAFMARLRNMRMGGKSSKKKVSKRKAKTLTPSIRHLTNEINAIRKRGRKIVKSRHISTKPFYFTGRKGSQIIVSEGMEGMAKRRTTKRRKSVRKATRRHVLRGRSRRYAGRKTYRRRSRRGLLMGGMNLKGITGMATMGIAGAAGAIGSAYIANLLPASINPKLKPLVPIALAVVLLTVGKKVPMSKPLAFGAAISGILGLTKQFMPSLPTLAGVESVPELSADEAMMLGSPQGFLGQDDYMGAVQSFGAMSPADI